MSTLSMVLVSRNDGYGGNLIERASYALNSMLHVADEVVYVDWNSPGGDLGTAVAPNLAPRVRSKLRIIQITPEFIAAHVPGPTQTCVEVLGRNIALRRARGDWIVSTNIDIVPPPVPLEALDKEVFYTFERTNLDPQRIAHIPFADYDALRAHLDAIRPTLRGVGPSLNRYWFRRDIWSHWNCCGDFQLAHRQVWQAIRGFEESLIGRNWMDTNVQKKAVLCGHRVEPRNDRLVIHINHGGGAGGSGIFNHPGRAIYNFKRSTNRDDWGFAQLEFPELRLDDSSATASQR